MLNTTDLSKAGHTGRNSFKAVILNCEVQIKCKAKIFNGFCGYKIFPQKRKTDVRDVREYLATSV